ncbi:hypothetical protein [Nocardioides pacificus]
MGIFTTLVRRGAPTDGPEAGWELPDRVRRGLPHRFEAVGEALASGSGSVEACEVVGRELARDGAPLDEALEGLRTTYDEVLGEEPSFDVVRALSVAWSEFTLGYLHQLSCEEPMSGLASLAHLRTRLTELYRGERYRADLATGAGAGSARVCDSHALVVVQMPAPRSVSNDAPADAALARALRTARLGEAARTVFPGAETIVRLSRDRIAVLTVRDDRLGRRVGLLRRMVSVPGGQARVWIEGLPTSDEGASYLLDELARP